MNQYFPYVKVLRFKRYLNFWMRYSIVKKSATHFFPTVFFDTYIFVKVSLYKVFEHLYSTNEVDRTYYDCTMYILIFPFYCTRIVVARRFECVLIIDANILNKKLYE